MFGYNFSRFPVTAYLGWRAVFHPNSVSPLEFPPDRSSRSGSDTDVDQLAAWLTRKNTKIGDACPWKWLLAKARGMQVSSDQMLELIDGDVILRASPQASYGYMYVGVGIIAPPDTAHEVGGWRFRLLGQNFEVTSPTGQITHTECPPAVLETSRYTRWLAGYYVLKCVQETDDGPTEESFAAYMGKRLQLPEPGLRHRDRIPKFSDIVSSSTES